MQKVTSSLWIVMSFLLSFHALLQANNQAEPKGHLPLAANEENKAPSNTSFEPFTGKVTKNKVRLRLQPTFDGAVLRELNRNDLLIAVDQTDDFYAIQPPADTKAFIFRTYVLDNVVEGTHVNVRLKPDLDAPVIAQLNSGDRVTGTIDPSNNKWLQINIPPSVHFYVAKDYIEKIGDAGLMARLEKRREEANRLMHTTEAISQTEMQKPFEDIRLDGAIGNYQHIIAHYTDFPEMGTKAKEQLAALQEAYTAKKVAHLEDQTRQASQLEIKNKQLADELKAHQSKIFELEKQVQKSIVASAKESGKAATRKAVEAQKKPSTLPINISAWFPVEDALFMEWSKKTNNQSLDDFYREQQQASFKLKGIIEPYSSLVKNKPGDYRLLNAVSRLPIGFLYSTRINLQNYVGHEITINVSPRFNNHFAYPAYFVLSVE